MTIYSLTDPVPLRRRTATGCQKLSTMTRFVQSAPRTRSREDKTVLVPIMFHQDAFANFLSKIMPSFMLVISVVCSFAKKKKKILAVVTQRNLCVYERKSLMMSYSDY